MKKRNSIIGILLIIISIFLLIIPQINFQNNKILGQKKVLNYIKNTTVTAETKEKEENEFFAVLEIPSINLKKGLTNDKKHNDVKYNIQVLSQEIPNNVILAAHSGASPVSFFNNLEKLKLQDKIYIYSNGHKYIYELDNYYEIDKTGHANIVKNKARNSLVLITCSETDNNKQVVYISYQIDELLY